MFIRKGVDGIRDYLITNNRKGGSNSVIKMFNGNLTVILERQYWDDSKYSHDSYKDYNCHLIVILERQ